MRSSLIGALLVVAVLSTSAAATSASKAQARRTSGPVLALAADGGRAAFIVQGRVRECWSVMVWEPARGRIDQLQSAARCEASDRPNRRGTPTVALAGPRAAWLQYSGGNTLETMVYSASTTQRSRSLLAWGNAHDGRVGTFARSPAGDGSLLAFTVEKNCSIDYDPYVCPPGRGERDIVESTIWRVTGGRGFCLNRPRECSRVATADSELRVLAVDAGRIVARTERGLSVLDAAGRTLHELEVTPDGAALSGNRLAVRTADAVEVYDLRTGTQSARFVVAQNVKLADLEGDILVTTAGGAATLRRLGRNRMFTFRARGVALAQIERPGLFLAGARGVTFLPMRDVLRRLG
jgi:hypothetical protein